MNVSACSVLISHTHFHSTMSLQQNQQISLLRDTKRHYNTHIFTQNFLLIQIHLNRRRSICSHFPDPCICLQLSLSTCRPDKHCSVILHTPPASCMHKRSAILVGPEIHTRPSSQSFGSLLQSCSEEFRCIRTLTHVVRTDSNAIFTGRFTPTVSAYFLRQSHVSKTDPKSFGGTH